MKRLLLPMLLCALLAAGLCLVQADAGGAATATDLATCTDLALNVPIYIDTEQTEDRAWFTYVSTAGQTYVLQSLDAEERASNTAVTLCDGQLTVLATAASESGNFSLTCSLAAGSRYFIAAGWGEELAAYGMRNSYWMVLTKSGTTVGTFIGAPYDFPTLFWALDSAGTLTLSGSGAMGDGEIDFLTSAQKASVTSLVIAPGITGIGASSFSGLTALESVTLPRGLTVIGASAFSGCTALTDVRYPGTARQWAAEVTVGSGNAALTGATIRCTRTFSHVLDLPSSLTVIEAQALSDLPGIEAVRIPDSLDTMDLTALDPDVVLLLPAGSPWIAWALSNGFDYGIE